MEKYLDEAYYGDKQYDTYYEEKGSGAYSGEKQFDAYYAEKEPQGCGDHKEEPECYEEHHIVRKKCQCPPKPQPPKRPCRCGGTKFVEPTMKRTNCFPKGCARPCCCVACRCECERPF